MGHDLPVVTPGSDAARQQEAILLALKPLSDLRRKLVNDPTYYREIAGAEGYRPGETKGAFLARHGASPGAVDPAKLPHYLLLVGDPSSIPFEFQCQLDIQHAVGRIHFDTVEEYAAYAGSVAWIEQLGVYDVPSRPVAFFAPCHAGNPTTRLTSDVLRAVHERIKVQLHDNYFEAVIGDEATRARILEYFVEEARFPRAPKLLVAAGHGRVLADGESGQPALHGALFCQEWPGPGASPAAVLPEHDFTAADIPEKADLRGTVALFWSSFSAGTPRLEDDRLITGAAPRPIAPAPMVSALAKRLLGRRDAGASALIGMVQRAASLSLPGNDSVVKSFQKVLESAATRLLRGYPVGAALHFFNQYYVELAADLLELRAADDPSPEHARHLAEIAAAARDARSFVVIGDPAARIPTIG